MTAIMHDRVDEITTPIIEETPIVIDIVEETIWDEIIETPIEEATETIEEVPVEETIIDTVFPAEEVTTPVPETPTDTIEMPEDIVPLPIETSIPNEQENV